MTEPLGLTPGDLRSTAQDLASVSGEVKQVMSTLMQQLGAIGSAWGDDSMGHDFANGPNGYLAQLDWVQGSIQAKTDLLDKYSTGLHTAANTLEQQDGG